MAAIYIAHAMTNAGHPAEALETLTGWLCSQGHKVVRPVYATSADELVLRALAAIRGCQILIADLTIPSHGVGFEIGHAFALGKRVMVVAEEGATPPVSQFMAALFPVIYYASGAELVAVVKAYNLGDLGTFEPLSP